MLFRSPSQGAPEEVDEGNALMRGQRGLSSEVGVLYPIDIQYFDKRELSVKWKDGRMQTFDISGELPDGITYFERRTSKIMKFEIVENMFKIVASVAPQNQPEYKCMLTFDLNSGKVIDKKII